MNTLTRLLEERYPIVKDMPDDELFKILKHREIFSAAWEMAFREGYNAAKEEKEEKTESEDYSWKGTWEKTKAIRDGQGLFQAVKYLRQTGRKEELYILRDKVLSL